MRRIILPFLVLLACLAPVTARAQTAPGQMGDAGEYLYPHLHNLAWDPANPQRVFTSSPMGGWQSLDAGQTWAPLSPETPNLHYGRLLLEPGSRDLFLCRGGDPALYASDDFGATWRVRSEAMYYRLALVPGRPGSLYALHGDWRLRRSDDAGATWRDLAQPVEPPGEAALAVDAAGGLLYLSPAGLFRSGDEGASWRQMGTWPAGERPRELLAAPDGVLVASVASPDVPSVSASALRRSVDGGRTWAEAPALTARFAVMTFGPDGLFWVGSDDGRVWSLPDLARWGERGAWRELPIQLARPIALRGDIPYTPAITEISPGPDGVVLIGTIHGIYRAATPAGPALLRARGLTPTAALPSAMAPRARGGQYFAATGHNLREPFLSAWRRAGGLAAMGMPRTEPFLERSLDSGRDEIVQYFERGRLGYPAGDPAHITAGRLGSALLAELASPPAAEAPRKGCAYAAATGQNVCGPLRSAWLRAGGAAALGLPLAPARPTAEGEAQWFERGRLEASSGGVTRALVGSEELRARGWLP